MYIKPPKPERVTKRIDGIWGKPTFKNAKIIVTRVDEYANLTLSPYPYEVYRAND